MYESVRIQIIIVPTYTKGLEIIIIYRIIKLLRALENCLESVKTERASGYIETVKLLFRRVPVCFMILLLLRTPVQCTEQYMFFFVFYSIGFINDGVSERTHTRSEKSWAEVKKWRL